MKRYKIINIFASLLVTLSIVMFFSACGSSSSEKSISGTWKLSNYNESVSLIPWNGTIFDDWFPDSELGLFPESVCFYQDGTFTAVSISGLQAENSLSVRTRNISGNWSLIHDGASLELQYKDKYNSSKSISLDFSLTGNTLSVIGRKGKFVFEYSRVP